MHHEIDPEQTIERIAPAGAEGANQGSSNANKYLDTSPPTVPSDSKLSPEEQKILQEANRSSKEGSVHITVTDADKNPPPPKKKEGFFKKLFGHH
jgi:hypothetical protein